MLILLLQVQQPISLAFFNSCLHLKIDIIPPLFLHQTRSSRKKESSIFENPRSQVANSQQSIFERVLLGKSLKSSTI